MPQFAGSTRRLRPPATPKRFPAGRPRPPGGRVRRSRGGRLGRPVAGAPADRRSAQGRREGGTRSGRWRGPPTRGERRESGSKGARRAEMNFEKQFVEGVPFCPVFCQAFPPKKKWLPFLPPAQRRPVPTLGTSHPAHVGAPAPGRTTAAFPPPPWRPPGGPSRPNGASTTGILKCGGPSPPVPQLEKGGGLFASALALLNPFG